jgi:hypothetical protein
MIVKEKNTKQNKRKGNEGHCPVLFDGKITTEQSRAEQGDKQNIIM